MVHKTRLLCCLLRLCHCVRGVLGYPYTGRTLYFYRSSTRLLAAQFFNLIKRFKVAVSTKFVGITTLTGSVNWWLKMVMIAKVWVVRWYDPVTGTFTPTGGLNTARQWHTATLLNNGMVPIVGGHHQFGDLCRAVRASHADSTEPCLDYIPRLSSRLQRPRHPREQRSSSSSRARSATTARSSLAS